MPLASYSFIKKCARAQYSAIAGSIFNNFEFTSLTIYRGPLRCIYCISDDEKHFDPGRQAGWLVHRLVKCLGSSKNRGLQRHGDASTLFVVGGMRQHRTQKLDIPFLTRRESPFVLLTKRRIVQIGDGRRFIAVPDNRAMSGAGKQLVERWECAQEGRLVIRKDRAPHIKTFRELDEGVDRSGIGRSDEDHAINIVSSRPRDLEQAPS